MTKLVKTNNFKNIFLFGFSMNPLNAELEMVSFVNYLNQYTDSVIYFMILKQILIEVGLYSLVGFDAAAVLY